MRRVYRKDCLRPAGWSQAVRNALPDYPEFVRQAAAFEKLGLNSARRRAGFCTFAPHAIGVRAGKARFPAIWGKHKGIVAGMSCRKCVYCEGPINAPRAAHVEHFHPKALFPSSAYEWTNYFLGCAGCNGAKGDKWPRRGGYLRPDQGDPASSLVFAEDGKVRAKGTSSAARLLIEDLDLNRTWLVERRRRDIEKMLTLLDVAVGFRNLGDDTVSGRLAGKLLAANDQADSAYSVAITQCFWRAWEKVWPGWRP